MKQLQRPITGDMTHTVALLTAAGMPTTSIVRLSGATLAAIERIKAHPSWEALLARKVAALEQLMRGDA